MDPQQTPTPSTPADNTPSAPTPPPPANSPASAPSWPSDVPAAQPPMPASDFNAGALRPKKKGLLVGLLIGAAVLVVGASGAAAYFGYYLPNKPQNVLNAALVKSFSKDAYQTSNFNGDFSIKDTESADQTISGTFKGAADQQGAFELTADVDAMVTKVTVDMRSVDGKDLYFKLSGLEGLPELLAASGDESALMFAPILDVVNDQWIELTQNMVSQIAGGSASFAVSDADRQKLADAYKQHQFLVVKETMKSETIGGRDSFHYKIVIDKPALKAFMAAIKDAKLDSVKLTNDQLKEFNTAVDGVDFDKYPVEVWIAKGSKLLTQIKATVSEKTAQATVRFTVTEYNKPLTVEKPKDAKSFLELLTLFVGGGSEEDAALLESLQNNSISL